jgi:hypothetical protein
MENTTCTTLTTDLLHDERAHMDYSSDDVIAHELAHHWFGDLVTCRDWQHIWLNEGLQLILRHYTLNILMDLINQTLMNFSIMYYRWLIDILLKPRDCTSEP